MASKDFIIENGILLHYKGDLSVVTIPNDVIHIDDWAFRRSPHRIQKNQQPAKTKCVIIPDTVVSIGEHAFMNFSDTLESINIPKSVEKIGTLAFAALPGVGNICVDADNLFYCSTGNCLIEKATKTLIVGCKNSSIPTDGSVTAIHRGAFAACFYLEKLTIPEGVTSIGGLAFSNCKNLKEIRIPSTVTYIAESAFSRCEKLTVYAPSGSFAEQYAKSNKIPFSTQEILENTNQILNNNEYFHLSVEALNLSPKTTNSLLRCGIDTVERLVSFKESQIKKMRGIGETAFKEIKDKLDSVGLFFSL